MRACTHNRPERLAIVRKAGELCVDKVVHRFYLWGFKSAECVLVTVCGLFSLNTTGFILFFAFRLQRLTVLITNQEIDLSRLCYLFLLYIIFFLRPLSTWLDISNSFRLSCLIVSRWRFRIRILGQRFIDCILKVWVGFLVWFQCFSVNFRGLAVATLGRHSILLGLLFTRIFARILKAICIPTCVEITNLLAPDFVDFDIIDLLLGFQWLSGSAVRCGFGVTSMH